MRVMGKALVPSNPGSRCPSSRDLRKRPSASLRLTMPHPAAGRVSGERGYGYGARRLN
jgi:hypothetical protein